MGAFDDVLKANSRYAARFGLKNLPGRAGRGLAVVTCMDSRIDPLAVLGLKVGDVKVLRNAGGRVTDEVLDTLVLAVHLLAVDRIVVMEHTACKMANASEAQVQQLITEASGVDASGLAFDVITDQAARVTSDVERVRSSPFVPDSVQVGGFVYDVETGAVRQLA